MVRQKRDWLDGRKKEGSMPNDLLPAGLMVDSQTLQSTPKSGGLDTTVRDREVKRSFVSLRVAAPSTARRLRWR
jgi:hypothetical protein